MPTDGCQFFYDCNGGGARLSQKPATAVHVYNKSPVTQTELAATCSIPLSKEECDKSLVDTAKEVGALYGKNLWHLIKSAVLLM